MNNRDYNLEKALEEVSVRNISAVVEYSKQTREVVRELEERINNFSKYIEQQNLKVAQLEDTITKLLLDKYQGRKTSE